MAIRHHGPWHIVPLQRHHHLRGLLQRAASRCQRRGGPIGGVLSDGAADHDRTTFANIYAGSRGWRYNDSATRWHSMPGVFVALCDIVAIASSAQNLPRIQHVPGLAPTTGGIATTVDGTAQCIVLFGRYGRCHVAIGFVCLCCLVPSAGLYRRGDVGQCHCLTGRRGAAIDHSRAVRHGLFERVAQRSRRIVLAELGCNPRMFVGTACRCSRYSSTGA